MLILALLLIIGFPLAKTFIQWYRTKKQFGEVFEIIAGFPILGMAHKFLDPKKALSTVQEMMEQCGNKSFVFYLGPKPFLIGCDPKLAEVILSSNDLIDKGAEYKLAHNWFGESLLTSTGQRWRNRRKILTPSFHYKILEDFVEVFDEKSKILVGKLEKEANNGSVFDIFDYVTLCTLDIICKTAMGTDLNCQENSKLDFIVSNRNMCDILYRRAFTLSRFEVFYKFSELSRLEQESIRVMRSYSQKVIANRRKLLKQNEQKDGQNQEKIDEFGVKQRHTFLDVLLTATIDGNPLTDDEISKEVDTFMFEGHDTTANAISFTIYLLGQHKDLQQKVYEEILDVIGPDKETPVNYEQLQNLKYTEMVLKESMRLFPPVAVLTRTLCREVPYENGFIPEGIDVCISPFHMHRNKSVFVNPEKFDPERFNLENSLNRHPYAYIPFSAGPRNCIGQRFAMLELKSTVSKILRYYEILPVPNFKVNPICKVTIESSTGILVKLTKRN